MFLNRFFLKIVLFACAWIFYSNSFIYGYGREKLTKKRQERILALKNNRNYKELRGAWIATVTNIDWPIRNGLQQEQEDLLIFYLNELERNNMNVVFFQVKPTGGTIYPSNYAPFAEEFTGKEEEKNPYNIDFLKFFIDEAHQRNIEVHAWVNPFRIATHTNRSRLSSKNFGVGYEDLNAEGWPVNKDISNRLISYGGRLYLNPGHSVSHDYVLNILREIVEKYDVDGIHFDDYFYQYETEGQEWLDVQTCMTSKRGKKYNCQTEKGTGKKKGLSFWRRENTNQLVKKIQKSIKALKPYVKWGVSPFGVWRNAHPSGNLPKDPLGSATSAGSTSYDSLSADTRLWYRKRARYVDYLVPQIYWTHENQSVSYNTLVDWWVSERSKKGLMPDVYVGHALYKAGSKGENGAWLNPMAMVKQVAYNRLGKRIDVVSGSVFFSMRHFVQTGLYGKEKNNASSDMLEQVRERLYRYPSVIPPIKLRKDRKPPDMVESLVAEVMNDEGVKKVKLFWYDRSDWVVDRYGHLKGEGARYYVVYRLKENGEIEIINRVHRNPHAHSIDFQDCVSRDSGYREYAVTSLDRFHNESLAKFVRLYVPK